MLVYGLRGRQAVTGFIWDGTGGTVDWQPCNILLVQCSHAGTDVKLCTVLEAGRRARWRLLLSLLYATSSLRATELCLVSQLLLNC